MSNFAWILQGVLAAAFLGGGTVKLLTDRQTLRRRMRWVDYFKTWQVKAIGAVELVLAVGLVVPAFSPGHGYLIAVSALATVLFMGLAFITHRVIEDPASATLPAGVLVAAAAVVVVTRLWVAPIS